MVLAGLALAAVGLTSCTPLTGIVQVALAASSGCAVHDDGKVSCWGNNFDGVLGDGADWWGYPTGDPYRTTSSRGPVFVTGIDDALEVGVGSKHACTRRADGSLACWGLRSVSGVPEEAGHSYDFSPVTLSGLEGVTDLGVGASLSCVVDGAGDVRCWGRNDSGAVGLPASANVVPTPVRVDGVAAAVAVEPGAGGGHACAILGDTTVACWGSNAHGQLGDGTTISRHRPSPVPGLSGVTAVAAGSEFTCALIEDGTVRCWGQGGMVGDGTAAPRLVPVEVPGLSDVVGLDAGRSHTCAVRGDGTAWCWGANAVGQLGDRTKTDRLSPVIVRNLSSILAVSAGIRSTCARLDDGTARCWGNNDGGILGTHSDGNPIAAPSLVQRAWRVSTVAQITVGDDHACARFQSGGIGCWGWNKWRQVGVPSAAYRFRLPVAVPGIVDAVAVSAGHRHSCAALASGTVKCWGQNDAGQLGDGTGVTPWGPVMVTGVADAVGVSAGERHSCALRDGGSLACWGANDRGQLGDGTTTSSLAPVPVAGITNAVSVSAGYDHTCAALADRSLRCWGGNQFGQLGNGSTNNRSVPGPVAGITTAVQVDTSRQSSCARLNTGAVRCWGRNQLGQLGDGTTVDRSLAGPVVGVTTATDVAAGTGHACATLTDGTVRCWGHNRRHQLGDGTDVTNALVPVPVTSLGGVASAVAVGGSADTDLGWNGESCVLLADATVQCWGRNEWGQIGDETLTDRPTPVWLVGDR